MAQMSVIKALSDQLINKWINFQLLFSLEQAARKLKVESVESNEIKIIIIISIWIHAHVEINVRSDLLRAT